jgi:HEAT repeat protein
VSRLAAVVCLLVVAVPAWADTPDVASLAATLAKGDRTEARMEAAKRLGASRDPRALAPLVAALLDPKRDVRWVAVEALGELGDPRAVPALLEYLKKPDAYRWAKRLVASALGAIGSPTGADALVTMLRDEDPFVRRLAALALLRIGEPAGVAAVKTLTADATDPTLGSVRREMARLEERRTREAVPAAATTAAVPVRAPLLAHEWAGFHVGRTTFREIRERLGEPLQESPDFLLYRGDRVSGPMRVDSVVLNADASGLLESIFVFPAWGTMDRDVRAVLGPGRVMPYSEFLKTSGRTAYGAGTKAGGKLHYLPPDAVTEAYADMGLLVVYDDGAVERLVKLIIVH